MRFDHLVDIIHLHDTKKQQTATRILLSHITRIYYACLLQLLFAALLICLLILGVYDLRTCTGDWCGIGSFIAVFYLLWPYAITLIILLAVVLANASRIWQYHTARNKLDHTALLILVTTVLNVMLPIITWLFILDWQKQ